MRPHAKTRIAVNSHQCCSGVTPYHYHNWEYNACAYKLRESEESSRFRKWGSTGAATSEGQSLQKAVSHFGDNQRARDLPFSTPCSILGMACSSNTTGKEVRLQQQMTTMLKPAPSWSSSPFIVCLVGCVVCRMIKPTTSKLLVGTNKQTDRQTNCCTFMCMCTEGN